MTEDLHFFVKDDIQTKGLLRGFNKNSSVEDTVTIQRDISSTPCLGSLHYGCNTQYSGPRKTEIEHDAIDMINRIKNDAADQINLTERDDKAVEVKLVTECTWVDAISLLSFEARDKLWGITTERKKETLEHKD